MLLQNTKICFYKAKPFFIFVESKLASSKSVKELFDIIKSKISTYLSPIPA